MINDYHRMLEKISEISGKNVDELDRMVEAKRAKLSGLISREGALQIISSELGINLDKEEVKINEIMEGMKKINVTGKIIRLFPVHSFKKETREGKVASFVLADETGNIRVVLWDTNHISLIEKGEIKEGDVVEITNANLRNNELHLTGFSDIKLSNKVIENVKSETEYVEKDITQLKIGDNVVVRAFIVQAFEPKFFEVCPECKSKVVQNADGYFCKDHGKVVPEKKALLSLVIDDGTDNIRAILFSDQIEKLGLSLNDLESAFLHHKENLLGKEYLFYGSVRQNKLFNNLEIFVNDIKEIKIEELIKELEK